MKNYISAAVLVLVSGGASHAYAQAAGPCTTAQIYVSQQCDASTGPTPLCAAAQTQFQACTAGQQAAAPGGEPASQLLALGGTEVPTGITLNGQLFTPNASGLFVLSTAPPASGTVPGELTSAQLSGEGAEMDASTGNFTLNNQIFALQPDGSFALQATPGATGVSAATLISMGAIQTFNGYMFDGQLYEPTGNGMFALASTITTPAPPAPPAQTASAGNGAPTDDPTEDYHPTSDYRLSCPFMNTDPTVAACRTFNAVPATPPY
jgi:hypothetical protein